jgi:hypothetical protein
VVLCGCGDPLVSPELIVNTRVLGARVESAADSTQAWPAPSEGATVRWLLAGPDGPPSVGWAFSLCAAKTVTRGLPICAAPNFAHFTSNGTTIDEPRFEFSMPNERALRGSTQVAVAAAFCESGTPRFDASGVNVSTTRCPERSEMPLLATLEIRVGAKRTMNTNPSFDTVTVEFDGAGWPNLMEPALENADCTDRAMRIPKVHANGKSHEIELTVPTNQSEPLQTVSSHSNASETLQLSHFVTVGELERVYSTIELAGAKANVKVTWTAPDTVSESGELHRLYLVLRDGRGGTDFTYRAFCVVP